MKNFIKRKWAIFKLLVFGSKNLEIRRREVLHYAHCADTWKEIFKIVEKKLNKEKLLPKDVVKITIDGEIIEVVLAYLLLR